MNHPKANSLPQKILIADDDSINHRLMSYHLKDWQKNLVFANNGLEALEVFREYNQTIGVVFMDVRMPQMDGIEATQKILEINPEAKVVALSAFAQEENNFKVNNVGFIDYMTKPLQKNKLIEIVEKFLK